MHCGDCESFNAEIAIHSPGQFVRIAEKVRSAVSTGTLEYNSFESSRELFSQPSFLYLDLVAPLPDVMRYHFQCPKCGTCFGLFSETYHGSGGRWFVSGQLPPNNSFKPNPLRGSA